MASIRISELRSAGSELFQDPESFLTELSESRELNQVLGGIGDIVATRDIKSIIVESIIDLYKVKIKIK